MAPAKVASGLPRVPLAITGLAEALIAADEVADEGADETMGVEAMVAVDADDGGGGASRARENTPTCGRVADSPVNRPSAAFWPP